MTNQNLIVEQLGTPDICDKYKKEVSLLPPLFHSLGGKSRVHGQIHTLKIEHNNELFWEILRTEGNEKVLFVDSGADIFAVMGDQMATLAVKNNWKGVVINGYIRDSATLKTLPLGIWALGKCPMKGFKNTQGLEQQTLNIYNIEIKPDDYLYADEDGIVINQRELTEFNQDFSTSH